MHIALISWLTTPSFPHSPFRMLALPDSPALPSSPHISSLLAHAGHCHPMHRYILTSAYRTCYCFDLHFNIHSTHSHITLLDSDKRLPAETLGSGCCVLSWDVLLPGVVRSALIAFRPLACFMAPCFARAPGLGLDCHQRA